MLPTKNEHGEIIEIVNWQERYQKWDWAAVFDRPWIIIEPHSVFSNRIVNKWKDGDIIIYNPDWTVKEWIKGDLHKQNIEQEVENEQQPTDSKNSHKKD